MPAIPRAFLGTFEWFVRSEVSGSILLLACTASALVLANSPLAGIGFTMSLFITRLAFTDNEALVANAKVGILAASLLSGIIGSTVLGLTLPHKERTR
jgi:Na+/H+ antiporter NhaA